VDLNSGIQVTAEVVENDLFQQALHGIRGDQVEGASGLGAHVVAVGAVEAVGTVRRDVRIGYGPGIV
jgi:hypothetical protein